MGDDQPDYDVIVVGLGAMGSSAAYHLARRGLRVLGIEQFTPAHAFGSSHGSTRIVRQAYFERPDYVPLLQRSYELWDELSASFGEQLFVRCGALMIGPPEGAVVKGTLESARRWGLAHELLDATAMKQRFPQFNLPPDHVAVFEANAGFARAEPSVLANIELAIDAGAELWFDTEVESVQLGPAGVYIEAADVEVHAPKAVIATGAWASRLAKLDQFRVEVQRQTVHWYEPLPGAGADDSSQETVDYTAFEPERFPVYLWEWPTADGEPSTEIYGFPHQPAEHGVKVALYRDGVVTDPDRLDRAVTDQDALRLAPVLAKSIPQLKGRRLTGLACMYAGVADDDFVLGMHPGSAGKVVLAVGFSGHGFKFLPVVGEIVADLVTAGQTRHEIEFLSPERISRS
ncbi:N-methyl-L-tryptophan oxidase [Jatrophihabitans sp. DSM 45814]